MRQKRPLGRPLTVFTRSGLSLTAYRDGLRLTDLPLAQPYLLTFGYDEAFTDSYVAESLVWMQRCQEPPSGMTRPIAARRPQTTSATWTTTG
jgi:hypothetical protein